MNTNVETTTPLKANDPNYHKAYYQKHKDTVGVYTVRKYAKNKYRVSDEECSTFGEEICKFGQYKKLKTQLQEKFPDHVF